MGIANSISAGTVAAQFDKLLVQEEQQEIQAAFTATPATGTAPVTVQFDASQSTGKSLSYEWDFGDGTTGVGEQLTHTYSLPGAYMVRLRAFNSTGHHSIASIINVASDVELGPQPTLDRSSNTSMRNYIEWFVRKRLGEYGVEKLLNYFDILEIGRIYSVTPDHKNVLLDISKIESNGLPSKFPNREYAVVDLETGHTKYFGGSSGFFVQYGLALSNDGRWVIFDGGIGDTDDGIFLLDTETMSIKTLVILDSSQYLSEAVFNDDASEVGMLISNIFPTDDNTDDTDLGHIFRIATNKNNAPMNALPREGGLRIIGTPSLKFKLAWLGDELIWIYYPNVNLN